MSEEFTYVGEIKPADETGISLSSIKLFNSGDGAIYHVCFDFRFFDADGDFYESADITVLLKRDDLNSFSIADIERLALDRVTKLSEHLTEHIAAKIG